MCELVSDKLNLKKNEILIGKKDDKEKETWKWYKLNNGGKPEKKNWGKNK